MNDTRQYFDPDLDTRGDVGVTLADGEAAPSGDDPFSRGEVLGRYVVLETLGRGGMGIVVSAYDSTLDRRVALKVLHPSASRDPDNHARLLREAQSLAKLSHPNVVGVYDVGELRGQVFIAMEFVDGPNLRQWVRESPRSAARILAVYRDAAKGLRAAHDAGIVHRDFKPDNVIIGSDGRARVTDFGLALDARLAATTPSGSSSSHMVSSDRLTEVGMVMGTPAYMPIEQHVGKPTDHRSDQFSFCVSLYESLCGVRPFSGTNGNEYCVAIKRGDIPPPPGSAKVPRRVLRAIERGLAAKPEDRHPSMKALGRALTPRSRSRSTWALGGLLGLAVGAGAVWVADPPQRPCRSFEARALGVFGPEHKRRMLSAFTATGLPNAQTSFDATAGALDDFTTRWTQTATEACLASERGQQSDRMLDLRMHCLDRGLLALAAMRDVLTEVDAKGVQRGPRTASKLPDLDLCSDLERLPSLSLLPETKQQAEEAETLLPVLERVAALVLVRRLDEALALFDEHAEALEASTYPLIRALHLTWLSRIYFSKGESTDARVIAEQAHLLALEHGLSVLATRTAATLGATYARDRDAEPATRWYDSALALARASHSRRLEASVLASSADLYTQAGDFAEAAERTGRALALVEGETGYPPRARAELLHAHAEALFDRDGGNAGLEELREARAVVAAQDGEGPLLVRLETNLSLRATMVGDYVTALQHAEEAVRIARVVYGKDSRHLAAAMANAAVTLKELGRTEEAIEYLSEATRVLEKYEGTAYNRALVTINTVNLLMSIDRLDDARVTLTRASALIAAEGFEKQEVAIIEQLQWSELERHQGDLQTALERAEAGLEIATALYGENHFRSADAFINIARVELERQQYARARAFIERARAFEFTVPSDRAKAAFVHARILWESPAATDADRERARSLARAAADDLDDTPSYRRERAELTAWQTAHDPTYTPKARTP